ncbi:MAG: hypothetical protein P0107_03175 [Nitrosomonas sp.]|nr:hypothetical protein [Nitrosomonas sp.]
MAGDVDEVKLGAVTDRPRSFRASTRVLLEPDVVVQKICRSGPATGRGFVQAATQEIFGKCQRGSQLKAIKASR